ncbi:hypothetical protein C6Y56_21925 [Pseudomonas fluorescens]|uniref:Uncharacterized protein n=1 Tax=Pseudomonas fluorescens TaxID=294 RepID=A0A7Z3H224_PSEFL|nr:hypothetical protein C6Y56_21925 [Pseudomonas fluorescens]
MNHASALPLLYNSHLNSTTIISEHHAWRTLTGLQTSDYYAYRKALMNGCHLQRASFELRHPEVMVCDLSNLDPIYDGMSDEEIIRIWEYLNSRTTQLQSSDICKIKGDGLSPELAVSGPSKAKLLDFKSDLIKEALATSHQPFPCVKPTNRGLTKTRLLIDTDNETLDFHNKFCAFYSKYISYEHWDSSLALNTRYIYDDHSIWLKIKNISKNKLFLLSAGLPLALGYLAATKDTDIFFSEIHRQNDPSLLTRDENFLDIFPHITSPNDSWLIIDKAYTGGSLRQAANMIRKKLGYNFEVKTLALFPKTFSAFMSADYAVYAGKLFDVKVYASKLNRKNWHTQLISEKSV